MENHAQDVNAAISELDDRRLSMGKKYDRPKATLPGHTFSGPMRTTWYFPVRDDPSKSRVPPGLFGRSSSSKYFSHDVADSYDTNVDNDDMSNENEKRAKWTSMAIIISKENGSTYTRKCNMIITR